MFGYFFYNDLCEANDDSSNITNVLDKHCEIVEDSGSSDEEGDCLECARGFNQYSGNEICCP